MTRKVRLQDIADQIGVSVGTVSRALAGRPGPGDALRAEIIRVASGMGWPRGGRRPVQVLRTVTLMAWHQYLLDVGNDFFNAVLEGIRKEASIHGILLKSCLLDKETARPGGAAKQLVDTDGILSLGIDGPEWREMLTTLKLPIVLTVGEDPDMILDCVNPASRLGARLATRYLLENGHRRIVHLSPFDRTAAFHRLEGFRGAMRDGGITFDEKVHLMPVVGMEADQVRRELVARGPERLLRYSAVFCASDTAAMGVIAACRDLDIRVPEDVSVIGFDDMPLAALFHPGLTTIKVGRRQIGRQAVRCLIERAAHPDGAAWALTLGVSLVVRGSTAPLSTV